MALLLNIRRLSQSASNATSSIDAAFRPGAISQSANSDSNEFAQILVDSGDEDRRYLAEDEHYHGAFRNPSFQADISSDENSNYPPSSSDDQATDCTDDQHGRFSNFDLSSADSGINDIYATNNSNGKDTNSICNNITPSNSSLDSGVLVTADDHLNNNSTLHPKHRQNGRKPSSEPSKRSSLPKPSQVPKDIEKQALHEPQESLLAICIQVFFPFLVAGIGTCGAGLLLDQVEGWEVFKRISELFILVPTLLGLKGNLEMTLASRVSTQVNLGKVQSWKDRWSICWGNMALVQCQATVMAFLSACFATAMSISSSKAFDLDRALLIGASALFTASIASLILGALTLAVVLASHRFNINPDNVATPLAASIGDVTTLGILAAVASYFRTFQGDYLPSSLCLAIFVALVPLWSYLSYKNVFVKRVLYTGWTPVIAAVVITSAGGYILEYSVSQFGGLAVFQPVINGVAGNLVAVQASRISTYFHGNSIPGSKPPDGSPICISPIGVFFSKFGPHARTARVLIAMVVPGHLLFGYGITWVKGGDTALTPTFLPIYLISALIQVAILLYIAQCLIQILWLFKIDPDNWAIPLLTALGDLSGMIALSLAFILHRTLVPAPLEDATMFPLDANTTLPTIMFPLDENTTLSTTMSSIMSTIL